MKRLAGFCLAFCLTWTALADDVVIENSRFRLAVGADGTVRSLVLRKSAIGVVGTSPYPDIDHESRRGFRILTADLVRGQKLKGASAALIAADGREDFLDCMDALEEDFDLPRGVKSRRSDVINEFIYHVDGCAAPTNIDRHIAWAKRGGFRLMTFDSDVFNRKSGEKDLSWCYRGDYDWNDRFPNGAADVKAMLRKVKDAGNQRNSETFFARQEKSVICKVLSNGVLIGNRKRIPPCRGRCFADAGRNVI